ncbi:MAG TPA: DUF2231 domain-containing protein [Chthoniobacterales bacterium]|jgi:uncharacterized membrane protein|nr:DUF2231 domain-containing protein [Chthoniobacterales bacterium]
MSATAIPLLAAAVNAFDLKAALLARHAQHPVLVHFPIALFIASAVFEALAIWRKQPVFASVAYFNLLGAALSLPFTIATGLGAWQLQLEGATLKGNLLLHLVCALTSAVLILGLGWKRWRLRQNDERPHVSYFIVMTLALVMITITGHVGGILSGVEAP